MAKEQALTFTTIDSIANAWAINNGKLKCIKINEQQQKYIVVPLNLA
ncbi:hypothetical protein [Acinetobacter sp. GXMZU3951]